MDEILEEEEVPWTNVPKRGRPKNPNSGKHPCEICQQVFERPGRLVVHMRKHSGERPFSCNLCHKRFARKGGLTAHMMTHTDERNFKCYICEASFHTRATRDRHLKTHSGEKPHSCPVCAKEFTRKDHVTLHMRIHSGERPYQCEICLKTFPGLANLKSHLRVHSGERPFSCSECGKSFSNRGTLSRHLLTHGLKEKPYSCPHPHCNRKCTHRSELERHMRVHSGDRPYKCELCGKDYNRVERYNLHMRRHNGEPEYRCDLCNKNFASEVNLERHVINSHTHEADVITIYEGALEEVQNIEVEISDPGVVKDDGQVLEVMEVVVGDDGKKQDQDGLHVPLGEYQEVVNAVNASQLGGSRVVQLDPNDVAEQEVIEVSIDPTTGQIVSSDPRINNARFEVVKTQKPGELTQLRGGTVITSSDRHLAESLVSLSEVSVRKSVHEPIHESSPRVQVEGNINLEGENNVIHLEKCQVQPTNESLSEVISQAVSETIHYAQTEEEIVHISTDQFSEENEQLSEVVGYTDNNEVVHLTNIGDQEEFTELALEDQQEISYIVMSGEEVVEIVQNE